MAVSAPVVRRDLVRVAVAIVYRRRSEDILRRRLVRTGERLAGAGLVGADEGHTDQASRGGSHARKAPTSERATRAAHKRDEHRAARRGRTGRGRRAERTVRRRAGGRCLVRLCGAAERRCMMAGQSSNDRLKQRPNFCIQPQTERRGRALVPHAPVGVFAKTGAQPHTRRVYLCALAEWSGS
jgi:hypothetical protein